VTVGVEHSSPGLFQSDFDFRSYWIDLLIRARFPGLDISQVYLFARYSDGQLPIQRLYTVDHGPVIWFDDRGFATLNENNFHGDRVISVYWNQSLGRLPFQRSGLPLLELLPFEAAVHGGVFWSELRFQLDGTHDWTRTATAPYSEIGFGLSNLAPFLGILNPDVHFTWQLSSYDTPRFRFHCGVNLVIL
jgi:hypothetical protein